MAVNSLGATGYMVIKKQGVDETLLVRIENFEVLPAEFDTILTGDGSIRVCFVFERDNNNILSAVLQAIEPTPAPIA